MWRHGQFGCRAGLEVIDGLLRNNAIVIALWDTRTPSQRHLYCWFCWNLIDMQFGCNILDMFIVLVAILILSRKIDISDSAEQKSSFKTKNPLISSIFFRT